MRLMNRKQEINGDTMDQKTTNDKRGSMSSFRGEGAGQRKSRSLSRSRKISRNARTSSQQREELTETEEREPSLQQQEQEEVPVTVALDDMYLIGIAPLDPMADDDSVVMGDIDRYIAIEDLNEASVKVAVEGRDEAPLKAAVKSKPNSIAKTSSRGSKGRNAKRSTKKPSNESNELEATESMDSMTVSVSMASTKAGGCISMLDSMLMCLDTSDNLERTYTRDSASVASSDSSSDEEDSYDN
jgi:hypothetical protein